MKYFLAIIGPGLIAMLADTEVGSIVTASQCGAQWGYKLLLPQLLIIPILYIVQEIAVRLSLGTAKGYGEMIRDFYGQRVAYLVAATILISCFGALITQMSGIVSIGELFGIPKWQSSLIIVIFISTMIISNSYHSIEKIVILLGFFELAFIFVAYKSSPNIHDITYDILNIPFKNYDYLYLLAASIGTSIMPWTIVYQQSALVNKGLGLEHLKIARIDTIIGAIFCQVVTAAIVIAAATTLGHSNVTQLTSTMQIAVAFSDILGKNVGDTIFCIGLLSGALVATVVICLAAIWIVGEISGKKHSLESEPTKKLNFIIPFVLMLLFCALLVSINDNQIDLVIFIGVLNSALLPFMYVFMFDMSKNKLPDVYKLSGFYAAITALAFLSTSALGIYTTLSTFLK